MKETACEETHMRGQRTRKQARQSRQFIACRFHKLDPAVYRTCDGPGWRRTQRQAQGDGLRHPDRQPSTHTIISNMGWSPDFCLMCDKQTDNKVYCSEACRLSDKLVSSNSGSAALTPPPFRMRNVRQQKPIQRSQFRGR